MKICCVCGKIYFGYGNNAWPVADGRCCDECNGLVIAERIRNLIGSEKEEKEEEEE